MKQRTDTKNEAKNWYQKLSKELIDQWSVKNKSLEVKSDNLKRRNREKSNIAITIYKSKTILRLYLWNL